MVGTIVVCVHNQQAPSDAEWREFLEVWRGHRDQIAGQIVYSAGGAPNARQREDSLAIIHQRSAGAPPTAVVTDSMLVRGAVTAISWVVRERIRAFRSDALIEACQFIGATDPSAVEEALEGGRRQVGLPAQLRRVV